MTVSADHAASDDGRSETDVQVLARLERLEDESRRRERELLELADAVPGGLRAMREELDSTTRQPPPTYLEIEELLGPVQITRGADKAMRRARRGK
mgnify:CR=1 FL=1